MQPAPPLTPLAAAVLAAPTPERALVTGCGEGDAVLFLAREYPVARVRGVDPSAASVRAATARVGLDPEGRVAFKLAEGRQLPFPTDHFDLVAAIDGLPRLAEVSRVLRGDGTLIVARSGAAKRLTGLRERVLAWRLRRHGLTLIESRGAGAGSFALARCADPLA